MLIQDKKSYLRLYFFLYTNFFHCFMYFEDLEITKLKSNFSLILG